MIQRIQTLYMFLTILCLVGLYVWFPVIKNTDGATVIDSNNLVVLGAIIVSVALIVFSIVSFKKRKLQFVLNRLAIILNFVLLGVYAYNALSVPGESLVSEKGIGILLPVISIVLLVLANKAIKRDEDLVKSVDRLR